jgi:hypothetical protein
MLCKAVFAPGELSLPMSGDRAMVSDDESDQVRQDLEADLKHVLAGGRIVDKSRKLPDIRFGRS